MEPLTLLLSQRDGVVIAVFMEEIWY